MGKIEHDTIGLSRTARRRLETATEEADKIVQADALFFKRFPDRSYRVRLAAQAEIDAIHSVGGSASLSTGTGMRWFCAVRQIAPGVRYRLFLPNDAALAAEVDGYDDLHASIVYAVAAPAGSKAHSVGQHMADLAKRRSA